MTASRGFAIVVALIAGLSFATPVRAVFVLTENFDNDTQITAKSDTDSAATFFRGSPAFPTNEDIYWGIFDPGAGGGDFDGGTEPPQGPPPLGVPLYTGFSGSYLVGEGQAEGPDMSNDVPLILDWSNLNITGLTSLTFSGLFAATTDGGFEGTTDANFPPGDYIRVQYRIDSDSTDPSTFTNLLWFSGDNDPGDSNDELALDLNFDGIGDGAGTRLSTAAQSFSAAIPTVGTDTTLDLRILTLTTSTFFEEIAIDSLSIEGVPEPSAFLFGGLVCGVIGFGYVGRRMFSLTTDKPARTKDHA